MTNEYFINLNGNKHFQTKQKLSFKTPEICDTCYLFSYKVNLNVLTKCK